MGPGGGVSPLLPAGMLRLELVLFITCLVPPLLILLHKALLQLSALAAVSPSCVHYCGVLCVWCCVGCRLRVLCCWFLCDLGHALLEDRVKALRAQQRFWINRGCADV